MNQCGACNLDFGSVDAFDAHRVGKHEYLFREGLEFDPPVYDGRRCLGLDELETMTDKRGSKIFALSGRGTWSLARQLDSARRSLSGRSI